MFMLKKKLFRQNISRRYVLMPVILLVFFLLFYFIYEDIKKRTINEFNLEQLILAQTASQGITSFFNDYESNLFFLSRINDVIDNTKDSKALLSNFYETHNKFIEAITRVDARGTILETFPYNESAIGRDISNQMHVKQVITTHKTVISDVFVSVQGYNAIALHVPVFKGKEYAGSLAILISIDKLGKLYLGKIKIRGTGNVWLLTENNIEIFCTVSGHTGHSFMENTLNDSLAFNFLEKIRKEKSGTAKSIHQGVLIDGKIRFEEKYLVFYRAMLGNTYWNIVISYHQKDVYNSLARFRNRLIIVFLLLFSIISYYFYSIAKVRNFLKEEAKRKITERTLSQKEKQHQAILQTAMDGFFLANLNGQMIEVNQTYCKMSGYSQQELLLLNISDLDGVKSNSETARLIQKIVAQGESRYISEHRRKDGSLFDVEISVQYFNLDEGQLVFFVQDITERKQAELELIKAKEKAEEGDHLKTAFLQNMSHEIRTPLNAITGFSSILSNPDLSEEKKQRYLMIIQNSSFQLLSIVTDILTISAIETKQEKLNIGPVVINHLIDDLHTIFKQKALNQQISLYTKKQLEDKDAKIYTDKTKINQVFTNLIINALKFTNQGYIEFGYELKNEGEQAEIEFYVKDTGIGIKSEMHQKIFERFRQADESIQADYGGTGLGLSISKGFIKLLGGKIWVKSEPDKGATFYFTIPYKPAN